MVFLCTKTAWPFIKSLGSSADSIDQTDKAIEIYVAATMLDGLGLDDAPPSRAELDKRVLSVQRRLLPSELGAFSASITALLDASGLITKGEAEAATGSTEIGTGSSPSS